MLNFDLYAIETEDDEYRSTIKELFSSFDEAMLHRLDYANCYRPNGDVWISKFPAGKKWFHMTEKWHVDANGNIIECLGG